MGGSSQPYAWITYAEARARIAKVAAALKQIGVARGGAVGIYATNCPEWMLAMKAIDYCGAKCVPLYDTFGPDAVNFIIKHSGLTAVFASADKLDALAEALKGTDGQVSQVVVWTGPGGSTAEEASKSVWPRHAPHSPCSDPMYVRAAVRLLCKSPAQRQHTRPCARRRRPRRAACP